MKTRVQEDQLDPFHVLSLEGPDAYARAGGIASRVTGLVEALARAGHPTHLWFVGDPDLPAREQSGRVTLRRWCQWISRYHPAGVYDGEYNKSADYAASLPPYLFEHELLPALLQSRHPVVLAEEWHTVDAVLHLDWLLREARLRDRVTILWNANNTFGLERIDWPRLNAAATIVTVSRYMKHCMRTYGVDPVVIPNGLSPESYSEPESHAVGELQRRFANRVLLAKVARWDPDKRWLLAVRTCAELKRQGATPLLVARGGVESHEADVLESARSAGLRVHVVEKLGQSSAGARGLLEALANVGAADMVVLRSHLDPGARGVLLRGVDAVLANSGHEPFGLVGLETMAVGGLACTGASGEDYAIDGQNALVLQQDDPREFVALFGGMRRRDGGDRELRTSAMVTARQYAWPYVVERSLMPRIARSERNVLGLSLPFGPSEPTTTRRQTRAFDALSQRPTQS